MAMNGHDTRRRVRRFTAAAVVACALVTTVGLLPSGDAGYASPALRVALETASTLVALLAAYLVFGRFRTSRRVSDLVLVCSLELIALRTFLFAGYPAVSQEANIFATWSQMGSAIVSAAALAAGAFATDSRVRGDRGVTALLLGLPLVVGAVAIAEAAAIPELPFGLGRTADERPYVVVQLVTACLFALAAVGFTRRAERGGDELMGWFAVGATVAAFGRLNYALFPPFADGRVYTGDVLRFGFAVLLLLGAAREIQAYWRSRVDAAALEERRRVARDLHDGLAQELAFIATRSHALAADRQNDPELVQLANAGQRALDESRRAIAALTRTVEEPLDVALAQAAEEVAHRTGAPVELALAPDVVVSSARREALVRITREAVANAARHGRAGLITVELSDTPSLRLRVVDDGSGFDTSASTPYEQRFGLTSMRERAESLGGSFRIESRVGVGTVVEVVLP
jgi:signal transduction histidine kinase